jgi:hypothetical protein
VEFFRGWEMREFIKIFNVSVIISPSSDFNVKFKKLQKYTKKTHKFHTWRRQNNPRNVTQKN